MSKYYIARNKDNTLRAFSNKPSKNGWNFWDAVNDFPIKLKENWFPEVKWEDKEPKILTIEESPWIKVEDRLPNPYKIVLCCCCKVYLNSKFYMITHIDINGVWDYQGFDNCNIVAWMSIPKFNNNGF